MTRRLLSIAVGAVFLLLASLAPNDSHAQSYTWLKNRWKSDQYIHVEHGSVQAGAIQPGWWSAMWILTAVEGTPYYRIQNRWKSLKQIPAKTAESDALSKDLKKRGFKFVGSTIIYAHMQAIGMVNDHTVDCFRFKACARLGR